MFPTIFRTFGLLRRSNGIEGSRVNIVEGVLYSIKNQIDTLEGTELASRAFNVLMKCYEDLVDLEMELDEG